MKMKLILGGWSYIVYYPQFGHDRPCNSHVTFPSEAHLVHLLPVDANPCFICCALSV
jgi:hypothetical protein